MRRALAVVAAVLMGAPAAVGDPATVNAQSSNTWSQTAITVNVGDAVTFHNSGGYHDITFDDGQFQQPSSPSPTGWTESRTFTQPGTYRFYCSVHGGPNGQGMSGTVTVVAPAAAAPAPTPSFTASAKGSKIVTTLSEQTAISATIDKLTHGTYKRVGTKTVTQLAGRHSLHVTSAKGTYRVTLKALGKRLTLRVVQS